MRSTGPTSSMQARSASDFSPTRSSTSLSRLASALCQYRPVHPPELSLTLCALRMPGHLHALEFRNRVVVGGPSLARTARRDQDLCAHPLVERGLARRAPPLGGNFRPAHPPLD